MLDLGVLLPRGVKAVSDEWFRGLRMDRDCMGSKDVPLRPQWTTGESSEESNGSTSPSSR